VDVSNAPRSIGENAFAGCDKLETITIGEGYIIAEPYEDSISGDFRTAYGNNDSKAGTYTLETGEWSWSAD
jgi:hypothetical protein